MEEKIVKWIKNNSFKCYDYKNLKNLFDNKNNRKISVVLPTLNEDQTIENIIKKILNEINQKYKIIDELIVIDGGSSDNTISIVKKLECDYHDLKFVNEKDILPNFKCKKGKGNQLWKALYISKGDIVIYCDSDIKNFDIRMIYGMIGPLLLNNIKFIKGYYDRPLINGSKINKNGGGRVTELCARPLINSLYPSLAGFKQPLAGEYGGYREVLNNICFTTGYSVEINILIEILEKYGINTMGQVDLLNRVHHNQDIISISKMSFAITNCVLQKISNKKLNSSFFSKNYDTNENYFIYYPDKTDDLLPCLNNIKNNYSDL